MHSATREHPWLRWYLEIVLLTPFRSDYRFGSTDETQVYLTVLFANIINMMLDIMIFILPIPLLFRSETPRNTRIGLLALFGLGIM